MGRLGLARGEPDGVEYRAEVAPVAAHGAFDGGFQFFDFFPAFGLASGQGWSGVDVEWIATCLSLLRSFVIFCFVPTACAIGCILAPLRGCFSRGRSTV